MRIFVQNEAHMGPITIERGEQVALVGENASGKSRLATALAGRYAAKYLSFRDSYGSYGDRNFFMQQRWNLFTLEDDPPTLGEALRGEAQESKYPEAAGKRLEELITAGPGTAVNLPAGWRARKRKGRMILIPAEGKARPRTESDRT